jgi:replicative DNA helicase
MILQKTVDASIERAILTGLITSKPFTTRIIPSFDLRFMKVKLSKRIAKWLVDYWHHYNDVPGETVFELIQANAKEMEDETKEMIFSIIQQIMSNGISSFNVEYWLERAEHYFAKQQLEELKGDLNRALMDEDLEMAKNAIDQFKTVQFSRASGFFITRDFDVLKQILTEETDELFTLPGPLGKLLGTFARGDLIAVCAPGKRGKTWWLIELAVQAWIRRLKVLFVSLEMTNKQVIYRFGQNLIGETKKEKDIDLPSFSNDEKIVEFIKKKKNGVSYQKMLKRMEQMKKQIGGNELHVISYPAYSATVQQIEEYVSHLEITENFLPDIVIVDYADILISKSRSRDHRHEIDDIWKRLRALAQKKNNLVITATHSNKSTFDRDIRQGDPSEDIRKINHVALMFGINQKVTEREYKAARIKLLASRHDETYEDEVVILTGYDIGKAWIDQKWLRNMPEYKAKFLGKKNSKYGKNRI